VCPTVRAAQIVVDTGIGVVIRTAVGLFLMLFVINLAADGAINGHFSGSGLALDAVRSVVIAIPLMWLDRYLKRHRQS
jgi:hypothetical protein